METEKKLLYRLVTCDGVFEVWLDLKTGLAYNVFETSDLTAEGITIE